MRTDRNQFSSLVVLVKVLNRVSSIGYVTARRLFFGPFRPI